MSVPRLRKCYTDHELESIVDDFHTQGFTILSRGQHSAMLRKNTWGSVLGHIVVVFLTCWWTFFLGNLVYALIAHYTAEKVHVKLELAASAPPPEVQAYRPAPPGPQGLPPGPPA